MSLVDMERIEGVTLDEEHLRYVRQHPTSDWRVPTHILYGENDAASESRASSLAMPSRKEEKPIGLNLRMVILYFPPQKTV